MNRTIIAGLAGLLLAVSASAAGLYRWVDEQGRVQYSDLPPPVGSKGVVQQKKAPPPPPPAAAGPGQPSFATQQAAKNYPVTLYSADCGPACDKARALLSGRGIPFTDKNAKDDDAANEELRKLLGGEAAVPTMTIGTTVLRGYEEGQWSSALDVAGYPRGAVRPTTPAKPGTKPPAAPAEPAPEQAPEAAQPEGEQPR